MSSTGACFGGLHWPFQLSAASYAILWEHDNRGPQHSALFVDTPIRFGEEHHQAQRNAFAELDSAGLLSGSAAHPDVRGALELIDHPEREFYCWSSTGPQRRISAIVAVRGSVAVFAMLAGDRVYFEPAEASRPVEELLGLLPPARSAIGRSINVHHAETNHADRTSPRFSRTEAGRLTALMAMSRNTMVEFHVASSTNGERRRSRYPLHVIDTDSGRWMIKRSAEWITATPADYRLVARTLNDMARGSAGDN